MSMNQCQTRVGQKLMTAAVVTTPESVWSPGSGLWQSTQFSHQFSNTGNTWISPCQTDTAVFLVCIKVSLKCRQFCKSRYWFVKTTPEIKTSDSQISMYGNKDTTNYFSLGEKCEKPTWNPISCLTSFNGENWPDNSQRKKNHKNQ